MGKKINKIINKLKSKKKIEIIKPKTIKKPTFTELRELVTKRKKHAESINFYKQKIEEKTNALKRLEEKHNRTAQTLEHEKSIETELKFLKEAKKEFEQTYDAWYNKNKGILELKDKEEGLLKLIRFHELEIKKNAEKIKKLEERTETENTQMYIRQLMDEQKINKDIYEHLKETFKEMWKNRHKK
ncbi:MAG: hypothetical protein WCF78_03895 [archaeon]